MSEAAKTLDARTFRDTIGLFTTGVAVIVGRFGDEVMAMTANAVTSVSLDPMLILFCPGKKTQFAQQIGNLTGFTVNFLRHEQQALSTYFAGGWREALAPPFRFVPFHSAPRLEGSLASLDCEPERVVDVGDHWVIVGRVLDLHRGIKPHRPLVFFSGRYRNIDPTESAPAPDLTDSTAAPPHIFYDRWDHP